jgi:hypothetical protein
MSPDDRKSRRPSLTTWSLAALALGLALGTMGRATWRLRVGTTTETAGADVFGMFGRGEVYSRSETRASLTAIQSPHNP